MKFNYTIGVFFLAFLFCLCACRSEKSKLKNGHIDQNTSSQTGGQASSFDESEMTLAFYNVENLFDIYDDPKTNDNQFLPSSEKKWTAERYSEKLKNLSKVIYEITEQANDSPDLIGLVEIENKQVIEDLVSQLKGIKADYSIVHEESPDDRGIDVGLIYNRRVFEYESHESLRVHFKEHPEIKTRDVLYVYGLVNKEPMHVFVNHWSSRRDGQKETEFKRLACAAKVKEKIESIQTTEPSANIILMGDFNDYPDNKSLTQVIGADNSGAKGSFFNLATSVHERGEGTYNYKGKWGALDQIVVSNALKNSAVFSLKHSEIQILKENWMMYKHPKYGDLRPSRSYGGPNYYGGYSDHLPIYIQFNLNF